MNKFYPFLKRWLVLLGIGAILAAGWGSMVWADSTQVSLSASDRGTAFSLMQQTASGFFSISMAELKPYESYGSPARVLPLLYMAGETNTSPQKIWKKHRHRGWGRMAREYGRSPKHYHRYMSGKHRAKYRTVMVLDDNDYEEMMTVRFLDEYYGASPEFIFFWRDRGLSYEDLFLGLNFGARYGYEPSVVFRLRTAGYDWRYITRKYGVPYSVLIKPVPPRRKLLISKGNDENDYPKYEKNEDRKQYRRGRWDW